MRNQLAISGQIDQGQVDMALQWLTRLPTLPASELPEQGHIEATVSALSQPVEPAWCMARVASLLNPYYDKDTPQAVRVMEAEDWMEALAAFPQWAIERAVRWWKSAENDQRRKRPLEGDIAAICKREMRGISAVPGLAQRRADGRYIEDRPQPPKQPVTPEAALEILASAGFAPRKMKG